MADVPQILVCGEALIDVVPQTGAAPGSYRAVPGGSPYNVAIGLGRLRAPVGFLGRLSRDGNGVMQHENLVANGVAGDFLQSGPEPAALAFVFPPDPADQDVRYSFYLQGTSETALDPARIKEPLPAAVKHLHFGSFSMLLPPHAGIFQSLMRRERGRCCLSFDPNARPSITPDRDQVRNQIEGIIGQVDIVKASDADIAWLYPEQSLDSIGADWLARGAALVVMTRGPDGARGYWAGGHVDVPGRTVSVIDTVGAGDSFMSTLLFGLWRGDKLQRSALTNLAAKELRAVLERACAAAALTCTRLGANPPTLAELEAWR